MFMSRQDTMASYELRCHRDVPTDDVDEETLLRRAEEQLVASVIHLGYVVYGHGLRLDKTQLSSHQASDFRPAYL